MLFVACANKINSSSVGTQAGMTAWPLPGVCVWDGANNGLFVILRNKKKNRRISTICVCYTPERMCACAIHFDCRHSSRWLITDLLTLVVSAALAKCTIFVRKASDVILHCYNYCIIDFAESRKSSPVIDFNTTRTL